MKIVIDAGHGGADPGAVNGKCLEKTAALAIAKKIGSGLTAAGAEIIYTRTGDETVELAERCKSANNKKADLFISVHLNSATSKSANGIETFAYTKSGTAYEVAQAVQKKLINSTGATDRGAKAENFYVLKRTTMPAILIETGFISNDAECEALFKDGYQTVLANAVVSAVSKYYALGELKVSDRYDYLTDIPAGEFRDTIKALVDKGIVKGNHEGKLDLSYDMIRMFVINYRAGAYN